uniref:uncharacterized protein LOC101312095 isoform X2 n=1 Tax=Fragaria vesca subsp. vesca TaxID=101020 RepID=UPI0005C8C90B|nr:PREDICTED: uncharacterized protein LOC101312095 isoform X2 [Fragaria vesca subsp. vesca]
MLKFLSQVRIEFNALDPRTASCMEFLAQCNAPKAKESNPSCAVQVKRRTDDEPLKIIVTFANGVKEVFDATAMPAQSIRTMILEKGRMLETEQMFHDVSVAWPVLILAEELTQPVPGTKRELMSSCCGYMHRPFHSLFYMQPPNAVRETEGLSFGNLLIFNLA